MLPTPSAFYFLNPSALKHYRDIISGSFYPEKHWHRQKITKCYQDARLNPTLPESLFVVKSFVAHFFYRIVSHFRQSQLLFAERLAIICLACI